MSFSKFSSHFFWCCCCCRRCSLYLISGVVCVCVCVCAYLVPNTSMWPSIVNNVCLYVIYEKYSTYGMGIRVCVSRKCATCTLQTRTKQSENGKLEEENKKKSLTTEMKWFCSFQYLMADTLMRINWLIHLKLKGKHHIKFRQIKWIYIPNRLDRLLAGDRI